MSPVRLTLGAALVAMLLGTVPPAAAQPVGPELQVNTNPTGTIGLRSAVAIDSAGEFVVVWEGYTFDGTGNNVRGRRYDSNGVAQGGEFVVNTYTTGSQATPDVVKDSSGNFVVVWQGPQSGGSIFGQRFDSGGNPLGGEFQVSTGNFSSRPAVAADSAGNFVVAYDGLDANSSGIFARIFDNTATPLGGPFQVNTYTTDGQLFPDVAVQPTGDFVVVWQSYNQDGDFLGVFGQRFDGTAAPLGSEFQVNTYTTAQQRDPGIAADAAGNFVVVWTTVRGSSYEVSGQRFGSAGSPIGGEFIVNTYTTGGQARPAVSADAAGNFVVVWTGDGIQPGIQAQTFDPSGARIGQVFRVHTTPSTALYEPAASVNPAGSFVASWSYGSYGDIRGQLFASLIQPCGNGMIDAGEACDEGSNNGLLESCCTATCAFKAAATACRPSAGGCDLAESCSGSSPTCPADAKSTAPCRGASDECDIAESCDGVSDDCPADTFQPNATPCNDGNACTNGDQCTAGACAGTPGSGTPCDDGNGCTSNDQCSAGTCSGTSRPDGFACDDGNSCTFTDQCLGGSCSGTPKPDFSGCDDGSPCTTFDACFFGICGGSPLPNGTSCNDHNPCTSGDQCSGGQCDGTDRPNGSACNDVNACTSGDQCIGGSCEGIPRPNGAACNDGNACTSPDQCAGGACAGTSVANGSPCDDDSACTSGDQCNGGSCVGAAVTDGTTCDDENDCTNNDQCFQGACAGPPLPDGSSCDDDRSCTNGDQCMGGTCDGLPVTNGTSCSDGTTCTSADQCQEGICTGTSVADGTSCSDSNTCTSADLCSGGDCLGMTLADGTSCNDGDACTDNDECTAGTCGGDLICGPTTDYLIPGRIALVKGGTLAKFVSKPLVGTFALPVADPRTVSASLRIFDGAATAGDDTYILHSSLWKGLGNPSGSKGYKFVGAGDPCKVVLVKQTVIKAVCKGANILLTPPFSGSIGIILGIGTGERYCAVFGGQTVKNDSTLTKRKDAPAPAACP